MPQSSRQNGSPRESAGKECRILACSPRAGGNCDAAAKLFDEAYGGRHDGESEKASVSFLRGHAVEPCIACNACGRMAGRLARRGTPLTLASLAHGPEDGAGRFPPFGCPLTARDDSAALLHALATAPSLCLVAPVYFYHLPARLKALVDRTQSFWSLRLAELDVFAGQDARICHVILIGARPRGEQLFTGSLLTLKYALGGLNIRLAEPLLLHGLDEPGELAADQEMARRVRAYAEKAAHRREARQEHA